MGSQCKMISKLFTDISYAIKRLFKVNRELDNVVSDEVSGSATESATAENPGNKQQESTSTDTSPQAPAQSNGNTTTITQSGEGKTVAQSGEGTTAQSGEGATVAQGGEGKTATQDGDDTTAAQSGEDKTVAQGGEGATAAQGGEGKTATQDGDDTTAAQDGDDTTAAQDGEGTTAAQSGEDKTAAAEGSEVTTENSTDNTHPEATPAPDSAKSGSSSGFFDFFWVRDDDAEGDATADGTLAQDEQESILVLQESGASGRIGDVRKADRGHLSFGGIIVLAFACALIVALVALLLRKLNHKNQRSLTKRFSKAEEPDFTAVHGLGARSDQQDSWFATDPTLYPTQGVLVCVADGMGGLSNGSQISKTAASTIAEKFETLSKSDPERLLISLLHEANLAVNRLISPNFGSGGTTLVMGYAVNGLFYYASVGDSRICMYRDGKLYRLNRPHIYAEELMLEHINGSMSYDDAVNSSRKGALTSYLGMGSLKYIDLPQTPIPICSNDCFIVMSDGVFNTLSDAELEIILSHETKSIGDLIKRAVEKKKNAHQDNYSAVVISF